MDQLTAKAIAWVEATHPTESAATKAMLGKAFIAGTAHASLELLDAMAAVAEREG